MSLEIVALLGLHGRQYAELGGLLSSAFPAVPPQLLEVEIARACEPRGGRGLVAVNVGQVAGVLVARRASACLVFVLYLATARRCRRRGVARTLVDRLAEMTGAPLELCVAGRGPGSLPAVRHPAPESAREPGWRIARRGG